VGVLRSIRVWLVVVSGVLVASSGTVGPAAASTASDLALLQRYEPVVVYPNQEHWRPIAAATFSPHTALQQYACSGSACAWKTLVTDPSTTQIPSGSCAASGTSTSTWPGCDRMNINGCDYGGSGTTPQVQDVCYVNSAPARALLDTSGSTTSAPSYAYGRVVHLATPQSGVSTALQYWFLYYTNDYFNQTTATKATLSDLHEGDWEMVEVALGTTGQPLWMAYSEHASGARRAWSSVPRYPGSPNTPMVWSAFGSHANYPAPGTYLIQRFTYGGVTFTANDHTAPTNATWRLGPPTLRPAMQLRIAQITRSSTGAYSPAWIGYMGAWGKDEWASAKYLGSWYQFGCTGAAQYGQSLSCTGPTGPAGHAIWKQPVTTALNWPVR
jgi:Vacuolar protein sorting-associated protein 62